MSIFESMEGILIAVEVVVVSVVEFCIGYGIAMRIKPLRGESK